MPALAESHGDQRSGSHPVRLIAVTAGSTVLPTRALREERGVALLIMAPVESGA
jgi:hypothetical protein